MSLILTRAQQHPHFVDRVMVPTANFYNGLENKVKLWLLKKFGIPAQMEVLNSNQCVELSTYLIAEVTSISLAILFILSAYWSTRAKQLKKEMAEQEEMDRLRKKVEELKLIKEDQRRNILEMGQIIDKLKMRI